MTQPNSICIPGYRIERKLGQGGMATVYLAIQESFDREVALKLMSPFLNSDPSFTTRFVREARIVAQIHHASIVPVMDVGEHQTHHYLSMEYLPGGDLKHRIAENKHGLSLAVTTCLAIASALDVAHRKGFVHRDIKPENILFREDGTPVLTDFGIARAIDAGTSLTMAGMMVGTPNYMSPEQVKGQELDGRSDLYSLGIVFFETLTGAVPFRADSSMSLALKHLSDQLPPLPQEFALYQPFIDRLTAKEREDRFASGAEVARALRLINEMAHPRSAAVMRSTTQPQMPIPVLSPTRSLAVPAQPEVYDQTLLATRRPLTDNTTAPPATDPAAPAAPAPRPAKVARLPAPPSKLALALKAAGPAARSWTQRAAQTLTATTVRSWAKLRTLKLPALQRPAVAATAGARAAPRRARPPLAAPPAVWLRTLSANPRTARHAAWSALGVAVVAFGFGGTYLLSRHEPAPQTRVAPPAPRVEVVPTNEPAPVLVAAAEPEQPSEEVLALVADIAAEHETMRTVGLKFERARTVAVRLARQEEIKRVADAKAVEKKKKDDETRLANEQSIKLLLTAAKQDYISGRIYLPIGNSAAERYLGILNISSGHPDGLAGLRYITDLLAAEIDRHLKVGQAEEAAALLARLRALQPQHVQLASFDTRLQAAPVNLPRKLREKLARSEKELHKMSDMLQTADNANFNAVNKLSSTYEEAADAGPETPGVETARASLIVVFATAVKAQLDEKDTKEAKKIVSLARKRNMVSQELQQWESVLNEGDKR
jgi:serine/threonine protein kinase